ncbi:thrombospondin-2-like [Babylonia areolata]|uniref:thrombospondin-2-like n=1 Tax=Babylonia areolata TaxID=304850 RepID=UPI003FD367B1
MKSLVAVLLLGVVAAASASQCLKTCTRKERYYTRCGLFGWGRCANYRNVKYDCYQYCENGGWSAYTVKSEGACSLPCGGGKKTVTYQRTCTDPAPFNGGKPCIGEAEKEEEQACNTQECPIDGGWSNFAVESVGECTKTCGTGSQELVFKRTCTHPKPQFGGRNCSGDDSQVQLQPCNTNPCPVDGGWSAFTAWEDYDECSALCGEGTKDQWRSRTCDNPAPAYGGSYCVGPDTQNQTVKCNSEPCGDKCPEDKSTFIANSKNPSRYYHCDNGVAKLQECQENTRWDQTMMTCVHAQDQQAVALKQGQECDPEVLYNFHPDCSKYVMCLNGRAYEMTCPAGTRFNYAIHACDHEENVPCITA